MIFLNLFLTFFKIGAFTFGGGYAMLPLIREEVLRQAWISETDLVNFIAVSESTPGPFAINIATYVGIKTGGIFGAVCSTLGVVLPSFIIILLVAKFFMKFRENRFVVGAMSGLKPTVIGLIGAALLSVAVTVFFPIAVSVGVLIDWQFWVCLIIFAIAVTMALLKVHPIKIIVLCALLGIAAGYTFKIPV